jgi:hypothetical protein
LFCIDAQKAVTKLLQPVTVKTPKIGKKLHQSLIWCNSRRKTAQNRGAYTIFNVAQQKWQS